MIPRLAIKIGADGTGAISGLKKVEKATDRLGHSAKGAAVSMGKFAISAAGFVGAGLLVSKVVSASAEIAKLDTVILGAVGSQEAFAASMTFLRETADTYGLSLSTLQGSYASFAASAKGAGLTLEETQKAFEGTVVAASKFRLSSAELGGALLGLQQLVGSTNVNLEDLRQVTDRIPGGMESARLAAAKLTGDMDLTTGAFKKLVSDGLLPSGDFVSAFSAELKAMNLEGAELSAASYGAEMARLGNAFDEMKRTLVEAGFLEAVADVTRGVTRAVEVIHALVDETVTVAEALASTADITESIDGLTKYRITIQRLEDRMKLVRQEIEEVEAGFGSLLRSEQAQANAIAQLNLELVEHQHKLNEVETEYESAKQKFAESRIALMGVAEGADAAGLAMSNATVDATGLAKKLAQLTVNAANAASELLAFRAGGAAAVSEIKAFNEEAALFEKFGDADPAALNELLAKHAAYVASIRTLKAEEKEAAEAARKANKAQAKAAGGAASAAKKQAKSLKDEAKLLKDLRSVYIDLLEASNPAIRAANEHAENVDLLQQALAKAAITQDEFTQAVLLSDAAMDEAQKSAEEHADLFAQVWKNSIKRLDKTFADMWQDVFDDGKVTLDNMKTLLTAWLAEMAHTFLTKQLVVNIGASIDPASGLTGSLFGGGSGGGGGLLGNLAGLAGRAGSLLGLGASGVGGGNTLGGFAGVTSDLMGSIGAGGVGAGAPAGLSLTSALPYVGLAAGIGLLAKNIFGGDKTDPRAQFIVQPTGRGGFEDDVFSTSGALGLDFALGGKSHGVDASEYKDTLDLFATVADAIGDLLGESVSSKIEQGVAKSRELDGGAGLAVDGWSVDRAFDYIFSELLDFGAETGDALAVALERHTGELTGDASEMAEAIGQAIEDVSALAITAEALAGTALGTALGITDLEGGIQSLDGYVEALGKDGESTADSLTRLVTQVEVLNKAAALTSTGLEGLGATVLLELGESLAEGAGGVETLAANINSYYDNFYSAEEKQKATLEAATDDILDGLEGFDTQIPATRDAFRDLIESLALTGEGGQNLFNALIGLQGAFDVTFDAVESNLLGFIGTMTSVNELIGNTSQSIDEWGLSEKELYERRLKQADVLFDRLREETSPAEIEALVSDITGLVTQGWSHLDDSQKEQLKQPMLDYLAEVGAEAGAIVSEQMSLLLPDSGAGAFESMMESLGSNLGNSATTFERGAQTMESAANMLISATAGLQSAVDALPGALVVHVPEVG